MSKEEWENVTKEQLEEVYNESANLYKEYIPYGEVVRLEEESLKKAIETFKPGVKSFIAVYRKILMKKLDYTRSMAHLPRVVKDKEELEELIRVKIGNQDLFDTSWAISKLKDSKFDVKLNKRELQYLVLLINLAAIPIDKLAAEKLGVSRESITRKGGIKDRLRKKLGQSWEIRLIGGRYDNY